MHCVLWSDRTLPFFPLLITSSAFLLAFSSLLGSPLQHAAMVTTQCMQRDMMHYMEKATFESSLLEEHPDEILSVAQMESVKTDTRLSFWFSMAFFAYLVAKVSSSNRVVNHFSSLGVVGTQLLIFSTCSRLVTLTHHRSLATCLTISTRTS